MLKAIGTNDIMGEIEAVSLQARPKGKAPVIVQRRSYKSLGATSTSLWKIVATFGLTGTAAHAETGKTGPQYTSAQIMGLDLAGVRLLAARSTVRSTLKAQGFQKRKRAVGEPMIANWESAVLNEIDRRNEINVSRCNDEAVISAEADSGEKISVFLTLCNLNPKVCVSAKLL